MSVVHRFTGEISENLFSWQGVPTKTYSGGHLEGIVKHVLVGPEDGAPNFIIRYFHIPVGKKSFFDQHPHEHGIIILHGKAKVQINDDFFEVFPLDAIFIQGNDIHQLTNIGEEPLGFICVIKRMDQAQ